MESLSLKKQKKLEQVRLHNDNYEKIFNLSPEEKKARERDFIKQGIKETVTAMQKDWNKMLEARPKKKKRW